ncbi:hypothetical protein FAM19031_000589 [Propionibacterium freudenreichii]|uniref:hypothetical protein n=1 Tax=Propionibacterium freudenreichii TaxID=1744 RepID=UPI0024342356|nr:hypothetical protein [Propionibacterium freudenreichii]MDK9294551.1 hypothetical protein [Propionibacterium freudenreichii]MDK9359880.1 hypothetical protein [Propionibacterium freudenreichii]MDK9657913.1 hypothetical protein [Propionibacterium freudenreichii]WFF31066.1 hypothetical protein FAM19024_000254 [Propionibacterium freudenreichii]
MAITKNTRVTGTRLGLTFDGVDYYSDIGKFELTPSTSDKDIVTFADAAAGSAAAWTLKLTAIISFDPAAFWGWVWEHAGETVGFILAPLGNREASEKAPHFTGKVKIGTKPGLSSEAGDTKGATFEAEWDVEGEPEKVTTGSTMGTGSMEDAPKPSSTGVGK